MDKIKQKENNIKKSNKAFLTKVLVGMLIALIVFPTLAIIHFTDLTGRIIGFIFYFVIVFLCLYEFSKILPLPKWTKFYVPCLTFFVFFVPYDKTLEWFWLTTIQEGDEGLKPYIVAQYKFGLGLDGMGYLFYAIYLLVPFFFVEWKKENIFTYLMLLIASVIISITGKNLFYASSASFWFVIVIYVSVIATDTFAYVGGKFCGNKIFKKKLAPRISPNKTIEGAIIGYLSGFIILFFVLYFNKYIDVFDKYEPWVKNIFVPITMPIVAIIGDLLFSAVKRYVKVKDFSSIIPSHGGFLDRLDSIIIVSFFYLMMFL